MSSARRLLWDCKGLAGRVEGWLYQALGAVDEVTASSTAHWNLETCFVLGWDTPRRKHSVAFTIAEDRDQLGISDAISPQAPVDIRHSPSFRGVVSSPYRIWGLGPTSTYIYPGDDPP